MRVVALHAGNKQRAGACELYRVQQPFFYMNRMKGMQAEWDTMHHLFGEAYDAYQRGLGAMYWHSFFNNVDVVVLARTSMMPEASELFVDPFFEMAAEYKVKVVYEVDDDFTNTHRRVISGRMDTIAERCDAITVTTPYLAEIMENASGRPAYILPNMLDPVLWRGGDLRRNLAEERPLIWLSGSETHEGDWRVLKDVFPILLKRHPEAVLVICGFHPDYLQNIEDAVYMDGRDYATYSQMVRQSDIVLAPVDPNDGFNMGKSPIKAVEGMGAARKVQNQFCGAAVIATDNPIYRLAIRNEHDGLLVEHTPEAWFEAMDTLLTDKLYRVRLQQNAYNTVWKKGKWDISRNWGLWADAYKKIAAQPKLKSNQKFAKVGEGVISSQLQQ